MIERPDAAQLLGGPLGDWLGEQVHARKAAIAKAKRRYLTAIPILVVVGIAWFALVPFAFELRMFIFTALGFFVLAWANRPRRQAIARTKVGINEAIARAVGLTYQKNRAPGPALETARKFDMLPNFDRSAFEDFWSGEIGEHPFELFEGHLQKKRSSGKNTRYVTVFRGAIMRFGFGTPFHGTTLLARDGRFRKFFGGRKDAIKAGGLSLACVDLVHPEFEDAFDLYSTDQTEARYLVDPVYCERLIAIEQAFSGNEIRTLFQGGEVLVIVEMKNMFESGSLDSGKDRFLVERTCEQFGTLADLARSLDKKKHD